MKIIYYLLNTNFVIDVLENIGNLYTRLRNYPKAHDILLKLMKSPHVQQLPLWSDVLRHQESFCKSNKARGRR